MNKKLKIFLIILGSLIGLWGLGNVTKAFVMFSIPTLSNYPTFKIGDHIWASSFKRPRRFDFICYHTADSINASYIAVHRLVGLPGDVIEVSNGDLIINGKSYDSVLTLSKFYKVPVKDQYGIQELENIPDECIMHYSFDTLLVNLSVSTVKRHNLKYPVMIVPNVDEVISRKYGKAWSQDNFGPYQVPEGHYFVMGDNRLNALDSRYTGPVPKEEYVCTVLFLK